MVKRKLTKIGALYYLNVSNNPNVSVVHILLCCRACIFAYGVQDKWPDKIRCAVAFHLGWQSFQSYYCVIG